MSEESIAFFEQMATIREPYHRLADAIIATCAPFDSVLDIGCGLGAVLERIIERGCTKAVGWDAPGALPLAHGPWVFAKDLLSRRLVAADHDLVICTETAEHLEPQHGPNLVGIVTSANPRLIVWSAAEPGDEWEGHVNLRPKEYWLKLFSQRRYKVNDEKTCHLRSEMIQRKAQHDGGANKFFVLERMTAESVAS